ncbi:MAG: DUF4388 domain-containing protein [Deltaproteobacteria bacterium]|nr:MAG: DUF4388 domain-containing protein [Deltaproteobacteria bacterium]
MALEGTLSTMSLADLIQWIGASRKTGTMVIQWQEWIKWVYFQEGTIISSNSNNPREYLGQFLLSYGRMGEIDLILALETQTETKAHIGDILVMTGLMNERQISDVLSIKVVETIYDIFVWDDGYFIFLEDELPPDLKIRVSINPDSIAMEGTYRSDEWKRFRQIFTSDETVLKLKRDDAELPSGLLKGKAIEELIMEGKTIGEMIYRLHILPFPFYSQLYELYNNGWIDTSHIVEDEYCFAPDEDVITKITALDPQSLEANVYPPEIEGIDIKLVPHLIIAKKELEQKSFPSQAGFIISRIDGAKSIKAIVAISPIKSSQVIKIIKKFRDQGLIALDLPRAQKD